MKSNEESKKRLNWKTVLLAAVVLLIVGSLIQSVLRSFGPGASGGGSARNGEESQPKQVPTQQQPRMVRIGNRLVPGAAGPIVVLNPGLVAPGGRANLNGSGFDPGAFVDVRLQSASPSGGQAKPIGTARVDRSGSFSAQFAMPETSGRSQTVVAQQRGGRKAATAQIASQGSSGTVRLNRGIGRPGDTVSLSAAGFAAHERINVYWGRVTGAPLTTLTADESGGVGRAAIRVGAAITGTTSLVLVGQSSHVAATAPFQMMSLYPQAKLSPFAVKSGQHIILSGYGFAPGERVLAYVNRSGGAPVFATQANASGGITPIGFTMPYGLRGRQGIVLVGEQSRAAAQVGFMVLPYSPMVRPSTYGGLPGTTLSFYVSGFAPNETVDIYTGQQGRIGSFQVNAQGKASAVGSYTIPGGAQNSVGFRLVGRLSGGVGGASVKVGG
ncbi:MAG TPA: hypothetical protein VF069_20590 [Streptosporangiaceae bacterium]